MRKNGTVCNPDFRPDIRLCGVPELWQWDIDRRVEIAGFIDGDEVQFVFSGQEQALRVVPEVADGFVTAVLPDEALQKIGSVMAYLYGGGRTKATKVWRVKSRPKPEGYIYTPAEHLDWVTLDERTKDLAAELALTVRSVDGYLPDEDGNVVPGTDEETLVELIESGLINPVAADDGVLFVDGSEKVLLF